MGIFTGLKKRRRIATSIGIVTVATLTVTTLAIAYEGNPTAEVDLNDGGVWLTKNASMQVGRFNDPSQVLDGAFTAAVEGYDVLQSEDDVFVVDQSALTRVDPARVLLADSTGIPTGAKVSLGGPNVAILDRDAGTTWIVPAESAGSFQPAKAEPSYEAGEGADVVVGTDGLVHVLSAEEEAVVTLRLDVEGVAEETRRVALTSVGAGSSITAVGDTAVVLDPEAGEVIDTSGHRTPMPGAADAVLQHASEGSDHVIVSTTDAVVSVPFDGSDPTTTSADAVGVPAAPVQLLGCDYAAWSGSARFVRTCTDGEDLATDVADATESSVLVFRRNRDVLLLNDTSEGMAWLARDSMQRVDNWSDVTPPQGDETDDETETTIETIETTLPERSDKNTPPIAADDDFGVRAGRTTVLPIIDNDTDADGDVLVATLPDGQPSLGNVEPIFNGTALQITVPRGASGTDSFVYEIGDGRGGFARATVDLSVHSADTNAPPTQKRVPGVVIESGGVITYNILPDWNDPDGDDFYLAGVTPADGDEVNFTSDGRITYRALAPTLGPKDVQVIMSDGEASATGTLRLDVRPQGSTMPIANADHVVVRVGETATVAPLANDISAGRDPLRLTRVDELADAQIVPDYAAKTFTVSSANIGTYYVGYTASSGPNTVPGIVRIDVIEDESSDLPPIAVRDVAMLPQGGEVLVGVLDNDSDPGGGILVVQSVSVAPESGISVAVLGHETLRVTDTGGSSEPVRFTYRISNGAKSAEGEVMVIPVAAPAAHQPPVANDDTAVVRAGDVVTIHVMDNDFHPNGDVMHISPELVAPVPTAEQGDIFVSENTLRFRATDTPGTVYATYEVVDSTGQRAAAYVTIQVLPIDAEANAAPRPRDLTARVLSGGTMSIAVPLDDLDVDGDSVELVGVASAPTKGRIADVGPNFITYEAFDGAIGVDSFRYTVRDRLGKEGTAVVRVGIAPPESVNQEPYAVKDSVFVRPGRTVAVPVLDNDTDPDGDKIGLVSDALTLEDVEGLSAEVASGRVVVTVPDREMNTSIQYRIRDARGAEATGVLLVTVDETVPLLAPIAMDDRVRIEDVDSETLTARVEVLANDRDPDGTVDRLDLALEPGAEATITADRSVDVVVTDERQLIKYTITDEDGLAASAFIHIPAIRQLAPTVIEASGEITVGSGERVEINLTDYVSASGGATIRITEAAKVSAVHANGDALLVDESTLAYTSAEDYYGPDAITFEVTDGTGPDDPDGRKATLSIPITVLPPANQQPTFTDSAVVVAPGEDAASIDLRALTSDPDDGDLDRMTYDIVGGTPDGVTVTIDGQQLTAQADVNATKGTTGTVRLRITEGQTEAIEGSITVSVTASTRNLPVAVDDLVPQADQGSAITVNVLENDTNPFPEPLIVLGATLESGSGAVKFTESSVTMTPADDFVGVMTARYRVQDATEDPDRIVEAKVIITVQGRPNTPGTPSVSSVQDRTVVLSWSPPSDNGANITGYTVASVAGGYTKECGSTTCTLDGLTNNVEYNFTVVAHNRVGDSDPSPASPTARPDARPDTPNAPTLAFGDSLLNVAWTTPTTPGSPVERFTLEISPAPPNGVVQKSVPIQGESNTFTWDGLQNGVAYQVHVQAINRAPEPSSWSPWSAAMVPAAPPDAPTGISVSQASPVGSQGQVSVAWTPPARNNGDAVNEYRVQVYQGGSLIRTIPAGTATTQNIVLELSTAAYSFSVTARNKAGWGAESESVDRRVAVAPGAPSGVQAAAGDNAVSVSYAAAPGNGASAGEMSYQFSVNNGGWRSDWDGTNITSGVPNNGSYTIAVRAVSNVSGVVMEGPTSAPSNAVEPYGAVNQPSVAISASGTTMSWSWNAPAPNGRPIVKMEVRFDGGAWQEVPLTGSNSGNFNYSQTMTIEGRATDSAGQTALAPGQSATTAPPPTPRAWPSKGTPKTVTGCGSVHCARIILNTSDFTATGPRAVTCNASGPYGGTWGTRTVDVPAGGSVELECVFGNPGDTVWLTIDGYGDTEQYTWPG